MEYTNRIECIYCHETLGFSRSQTKRSFAMKCLKCMPQAHCLSCGVKTSGVLTKCVACMSVHAQAFELKPTPGFEINIHSVAESLNIRPRIMQSVAYCGKTRGCPRIWDHVGPCGPLLR